MSVMLCGWCNSVKATPHDLGSRHSQQRQMESERGQRLGQRGEGDWVYGERGILLFPLSSPFPVEALRRGGRRFVAATHTPRPSTQAQITS